MRIIWIFSLLFLFSCGSQENNLNQKETGQKGIEKQKPAGFNHYDYYTDGKLKIAANMVDNKYHGEYQEYYKNGVIKLKGKYNNDQRISIWRLYNSKGDLENVELYRNGKVINAFAPLNFEMETVKSGQLQFDVPKNWDTEVAPDSNILLTTVERIDSADFSSNFSITIADLSNSDYSFQEIIDMNMKAFKDQSAFFKIIAQGKPNFNFPSEQIVYILQTNDGYKLAGVTTFVLIDDYVFNMSGLSRNEEKGEFIEYKVLFQEMTGSLRKHSDK